MNPYGLLSHLGLSLRAFLQNPVTSGASTPNQPSKPCHIWDRLGSDSFKTLSHLGQVLEQVAFKTLSHLGGHLSGGLQNPVTSGIFPKEGPSKPCHIWEARRHHPFKTLSHLGLSR